jgi:1,4-dihydroxy-2-naphthoyl-CoA hydrolase
MDYAAIVKTLNEKSVGRLPGLFGLEVLNATPGTLKCRLKIRDEFLAANGYLHAATVIALADTSCGYGTMANLPPGASLFTTVELKSNFLGTATSGFIECEAKLIHGGKTTQVWDATVIGGEFHKVLALFRCTQMLLYK